MARSIPRSLTMTSRGLHWIASLGISSPGSRNVNGGRGRAQAGRAHTTRYRIRQGLLAAASIAGLALARPGAPALLGGGLRAARAASLAPLAARGALAHLGHLGGLLGARAAPRAPFAPLARRSARADLRDARDTRGLARGRSGEVGGRSLAADLRQAPALEPFLERTRKLLRLQTELLANLLGSQSTGVFAEQAHDLLDRLRDVAGGAARKPPPVAAARRRRRGTRHDGRRGSVDASANRHARRRSRLAPRRLREQLFERSAANGVEHTGGKRCGELAQAIAEGRGHDGRTR